jgi:hypothetical protein
MSPRFAAIAATSLVLVASSTARASGPAEYETQAARSDRLHNNADSQAMIELRVTPSYYPNVDSEFSNGATPFAQIFGTGANVQVGFEVDYELLHLRHFGSLGVGGMFSYTSFSGTALPTDPTILKGETVQEQVGFLLFTGAALAVLRVDVVARETWIPLVPYAKIGPAIALWNSSNGRGTSIYDRGDADQSIGRGKTGGMVYAIGGMFLLDALDEHTAKAFRVERGINHTYAFAEYTITQLNGLGQTAALHVGDRAWTFGLAFEL